MLCDHLLLFCLWTEWCRALFSFSLLFFFFFSYWYCTGSGIISSDNICLFSLDVCLCPALYLIWNHHSVPRRRLFKIRLITSTFNLVGFFSRFPSSFCFVAGECFFPCRWFPKIPLQHILSFPFIIQTFFSNVQYFLLFIWLSSS